MTTRPDGAAVARPTTRSIDRALSSLGFFADPHPVYEKMRGEWPAFWSAELGRWVVTRYADVAAGLRRQDLSNAGRTTRLLNALRRHPLVGWTSHCACQVAAAASESSQAGRASVGMSV